MELETINVSRIVYVYELFEGLLFYAQLRVHHVLQSQLGGWHVIKLEDTRALQAPEFDKVKEGLAKTLQQKQLDKLVLDLKAKAKIVDNRK